MSKLGDYIKTLKNQTDNLRKVVSAKCGVDCTKMSISECTDVIDTLKPDAIENLGYQRPNWYPDIEDIVMKAPDIVKEGVTYYPVYILLLDGNNPFGVFYTASSSTASAINYYSGTGCDAYIFSDDVDNDIANANENTLVVGTTIEHTWDNTKNITFNPDAVRWVVCYVKSATKTVQTMSCRGYMPVLEIVVRQGQYRHLLNPSMQGGSSSKCPTLKYLKFCKDVQPSGTSQIMCYHYESGLEKIVNNSEHLLEFTNTSFSQNYYLKEFENTGKIVFNNAFCSNNKLTSFEASPNNTTIASSVTSNIYNCPNLKRLIIDTQTLLYGVYDCPNLEYLELHNINTIKISNNYLGTNCPRLQYIKIPSTLEVWNTSSNMLNTCTYIELFKDFNISGVNLSGITSFPKSIQWLKDLCIWLKDRTGEEAGSFIIGTHNLVHANNIYLTFNPNDKRDITFDGVTSETEGAISITEFITNQLNWTLS